MEVEKKEYQFHYFKKQMVSQLTMDEDFNIPDAKEDIEKYITCDTMVHMEQVKSSEGKVSIRGQVDFKLLYISREGKIQGMENAIAFDEIINGDEIKSSDNIHVKYCLEDFNVSIINTRKINIRGILTFFVCSQEMSQIEAVNDLSGEEVHCRRWKGNVLQTVLNKKDTYRIREEIELPQEKPNIAEILWSTLTLNNISTRLEEDRVSLSGEIRLFFMYDSEGEETPVQWMWVQIPFDGTIDVPGCMEGMIGEIDTSVSGYNLNLKTDYDGEQRMVELEVVMELAMHIYQEEEVEILRDVYSLKEEVGLQLEKASYSRLGIRNRSTCKIEDKLRIKKETANILQVLTAQGSASVEEVIPEEKGIRIEGVIRIKLMYVRSDDGMPLGIADEILPFSHLIETGENTDAMPLIRPSIRQIQASMSGKGEIEIKCQVLFDTMLVEKCEMEYIAQLECKPMDLKRIQKIPGMAGYVVRENDTLWDIAKRYCTTVEEIMKLNERKSEQIKKGEMLLLVKQYMG